MSVMRPEGPESPRSAGLTPEKQEKGQTREARDGDTQRDTHTSGRGGGERLMKGETEMRESVRTKIREWR